MPQAYAAAHADIDRSAAATLGAIRQCLRMPSFSDTGEGIAQTAAWFLDRLRQLDPDATAHQTDGNPILTARVPGPRPGGPTLLLYGLYDVTPTQEQEWTVDPLGAHVVAPERIGLPAELGPLLVGRGANNHKGPVIAALAALRAMRDAAPAPGTLPIETVIVIEGEEEVGSPSLGPFLAAHPELLSRQIGTWLPCAQQNRGGTMTLRRAYKGSVWAHLTCRGGDWGGPADGRHVWAGNSVWIDAPLMQLVRALATLFDDDQRTTIDDVDSLLGSAVHAMQPRIGDLVAEAERHPEWERNLLAGLGAQRPLAGKPLHSRLADYVAGVALNVQGIAGGYRGPSYYTMLPGTASARIDVRFPPGNEPAEVVKLIRAHLDRRGFTHVELENVRGYPGRQAVADDLLLTVASSVAETYSVPVAVWPMANNCCPAALLCAPETSFSIAGLGHGDRAHAPDEYLTVNSVPALMHFTVDFVAAVAESAGGAVARGFLGGPVMSRPPRAVVGRRQPGPGVDRRASSRRLRQARSAG